MKILSLQPFFGGSHRNFNDQWIAHSRHDWTVLSLPDRHWKWRMRHAPLEFADQITKLKSQGHAWDAIIGTDMLDVAALKGLIDLSDTPLIVYFHENQFAYPAQRESEADLHFAFTNFTTMVAADRVWFNSQFNLDSTIKGAERLLKRFPDFQPVNRLDDIRDKSIVQSPGIEVPKKTISICEISSPIVITWAARWEHDKGPDQLEALLLAIADQAIDFRINIIGQTYETQPTAFARIKEIFGNRIDAWGFQSREQYREILGNTDVFLSTADHEFFGLSVVEAISRGALPMVPNRLAYPEVVGMICDDDTVLAAQFLYNGTDDAVKKIKALSSLSMQSRQAITKRCQELYGWESRAVAMDDAL